MKKRILATSAAGVACLLATVLLGADLGRDRPASSRETDQLRAQVQALEGRLKALEQRVHRLETKSGPVFVVPDPKAGGPPPTIQILPGPPPRPPRGPSAPPKIWGQGECNGWPYYLVPLSAGDGGAGR